MRRCLAVVTVVVAGLVLAGCGGPSDRSATEGGRNQPGPGSQGRTDEHGPGMMDGGSGGGPGMMDGGSGGGPGMMGEGSGMGHGKTSPTVAGAREVAVTATSFAFQPKELRLKAGEDITIVLSNRSDTLHDFTVDELGAHVAAQPSQVARGGLRAPRPGRYAYYCTVAGHRQLGMEGTLIVES